MEESRADKIARLETELEERKGDRKKLIQTDPFYAERDLALVKDMSLIRQEKLLLMEQQGKFASPISVVVSHSYR